MTAAPLTLSPELAQRSRQSAWDVYFIDCMTSGPTVARARYDAVLAAIDSLDPMKRATVAAHPARREP